MIGRILITAIFVLRLSGQCIEVAGDQILAHDLSPAVPGFAAVAGDVVFGLSPVVGARRMLRAAELRRFATLHGLELLEAREICIAREGRTLTGNEVVAAMRTSLNEPDVSIALVDYTRGALPAGILEFPIAALSAPQPGGSGVSTWRGRIRAPSGRTSPVWAQARITKRSRFVIASRTIPCAHTISADDVELRDMDVFPRSMSRYTEVAEAIGKEVSRTIPAGTVLERQMVRSGATVKRGQSVRVGMRNGAVTFFFDGIAETTARAGDGILFRNPLNGRFVRAIVRENGTAEIELNRVSNVHLSTTPNRSGDSGSTGNGDGTPQTGTDAR